MEGRECCLLQIKGNEVLVNIGGIEHITGGYVHLHQRHLLLEVDFVESFLVSLGVKYVLDHGIHNVTGETHKYLPLGRFECDQETDPLDNFIGILGETQLLCVINDAGGAHPIDVADGYVEVLDKFSPDRVAQFLCCHFTMFLCVLIRDLTFPV